MQAHEHFAEGQRNLAQASTASQPERLIGLAHGHFLAAQAILAASQTAHLGLLTPHEAASWERAEAQQFLPDGKPLR